MNRRVGTAAAAMVVALLAAGCGGSGHQASAAAVISHSTASTAIEAGGGQSLAGMPGATGTGSGADAASMPGMTMPTVTGSSGAAAVPVVGNAVAIMNFAFSPAALSVKVGTTVTWTNKDADAHTVTSQGSGGPLNSAALATGQSYSYTFTTPGTYSYLCTIHPFMTATVTVTR